MPAHRLRRPFAWLGVLLNLVELALVASFAAIFFPLTRDDLTLAALAIGPPLFIALGYRALVQSARLRPIERFARGEGDAESALEAIVTTPRRALVERSVVTTLLYALAAPAVAAATHLQPEAAYIIAGGGTLIAFGVNVLRATLYRRLLDRRLPELGFAGGGELRSPAGGGVSEAIVDPRLLAGTLRERLFCATFLPGVVGHLLVVVYLWRVLGVPVPDLAEAMKVLPVMHATVGVFYVLYLFRASRPLVKVLVAARPKEEDLANVARTASTLPARLGAAALTYWFVGSAALAVRYWWRGALPSEAAAVLAGLGATGVAATVFQAVWTRRIVAPVRTFAERALPAPPPPLLVSLRLRMLVSLLAVIAFAGTFAYVTALMGTERAETQAAGLEAQARLAALLPRVEASLAGGDDLAHALAATWPQPSELVFALKGGVFASSSPVSLPERVLDAIDDGGAGILPVPAMRASAAWATAKDGTAVGVVRPWRPAAAAETPTSIAALTFFFLVLMAVSLGISALAAGDIARPVAQLAEEAKRLGRGELDRPLPPADAVEIAELAQAFDAMRRALRDKIAALDEMNRTLERRVDDRTAELRAAQEQLIAAEKLAALGRLVAGVAHEVNNPLNFILNALPPLTQYLDGLDAYVRGVERAQGPADEPGPERAGGPGGPHPPGTTDARELVRIMGNGAERMRRIVGSLRDFARADDGGAEKAPVDLKVALDDALDLLRPDLAGRVEVVRRYDPQLPPVQGHAGPLGQVFLNLIKNAAQAVEGREGPRLEIVAEPAAGGARVVVRDNGPGIEPAVLGKIFEPFFTTKPVGRGTGLGLSICHGIVQKHGGRIEVQSAPGAGTAFSVFLPSR